MKKQSLLEKKMTVDEIAANAQAEYEEFIKIAQTHITTARNIIIDNDLVPILILTEQELLDLLKKMYKMGWENIKLIDPKIDYEIKALTQSSTIEEVDYEIVDEKNI